MSDDGPAEPTFWSTTTSDLVNIEEVRPLTLRVRVSFVP
jgi:hypothetical protein